MKQVLKITGKILSYALFVFLLLIILLLLIYVVDVKVKEKQNKVSSIPYNFYVILTQSMYPTIEAGDMVITYKLDKGYKIGDVITFNSTRSSSEAVTITHRVVDTVKTNGVKYYQTKGDNNNAPDTSRVSEKDVIGKVIVKIPKVGFIQEFIATKSGWIAVVVVPCLGLIIYDIIKLAKAMVKKGKKNVKPSNKSLDKKKKTTTEKIVANINETDQEDIELL